MPENADFEREFRLAALQAGFWLGWLSLAALLAALALGSQVDHRGVVLSFVGAAALANGLMMLLPWRRWLVARRGQLVLDLWSAALIGFAGAVVLVAGASSDFDLLFFLVLPFVASAQGGRRRPLWVAAAGVAFLLSVSLAQSAPSAGAVVVRAGQRVH